MESVKVIWYDALKGIGEGVTSQNETVFLNWHFVINEGIYKGMRENETVQCEIVSNLNGTKYARKILKKIAKVF